MHHPFLDMVIVGAVGLGAYELWHHHHYGNFGFGNPYNHAGFGGYSNPYGYSAPYGFNHPHHHHHVL
ncbi:unnamed protein product [Adineta steineri]|uniref:Uncharacterized protein n=1 Tax=Adineta steineri TaxID=433720 RepID=A0A813MAL0_9BILA|nr:unnamed protein product [Adineta steineri]